MSKLWSWFVANREPAVSVATGLGGAVALLVAFGQLRTARMRHEAQTDADMQRRITESFMKAVEQLGSQKLEVRLGGIFSLERISIESAPEYWTVMETLCAFVRQRSPWLPSSAERDSIFNDVDPREASREKRFPSDAQAVLTVLGRRDDRRSPRRERLPPTPTKRYLKLDLSYTDLRGARFIDHPEHSKNFSEIDFTRSNLQGVAFYDINFSQSDFSEADLEGVDFNECDFSHATFDGACMQRLVVNGANFNTATFVDTSFANSRIRSTTAIAANFFRASFRECVLDDLRWDGANVAGADFSGAMLSSSMLDDTEGDMRTKLPENLSAPAHWKRNRGGTSKKEPG